MKDALGGQIIKKLAEKREKTYSYSKDNNDEDKKAKSTKTCVIKRKLTFQYYKNCLEAVQTETKITHLEKNKIGVAIPKEFIKNNKLFFKTKRRCKSKRECFY